MGQWERKKKDELGNLSDVLSPVENNSIKFLSINKSLTEAEYLEYDEKNWITTRHTAG